MNLYVFERLRLQFWQIPSRLSSYFSGDPIYVTGGKASSEWSTGWALSLGYSKEGVAQTPGSCFYSKANKNQWAVLNIPSSSSVEEVKLQAYSKLSTNSISPLFLSFLFY